jgi:hypothetical protein
MADCCPQKLVVRFLSLDFLQDHRLLKDAWLAPDGKMEWRNTGTLYTPHDWISRNDPNPVSYSMVKNLQAERRNPVQITTKRGYAEAVKANRNQMQVQVRLQITPECACPEKCQIYGVGQEQFGERRIMFESGWIVLAPSADRSVTLSEVPFVPVRVSYFDLTIDWYIKSHPSSSQQSFPAMFNMETTVNRRYMTFGKPILSGSRESGVTHRRMFRSVEWVGAASTNDHPYIFNYLFGRYDAYTLVELRPAGSSYSLGYSNLKQAQKDQLRNDPALLKRLGDAGWSTYFRTDVGAWPAADPELVKFGAECQAICRLVIGMIHQLGSPANLSLVYATADFSKPDEAIIDGHTQNKPSGPDPTKSYILVDTDVKKGTKYIAPVLDPADGQLKIPPGKYADTNSVGWNNFEAYLRYRYKEGGSEKNRWYGGGIGEHKGNPVHVFWGLVEFEWGSEQIFGQLVSYRLITRIHEYPGEESADDDDE